MPLPVTVRDDILSSGLVDRIYEYEILDSTNAEAKRLIEKDSGIAPGTLIISGSQDSGVGRFGRVWFSPEGGLYLSLVIEGELLPSFTLVTGLAVAETLEAFINRGTRVSWPNDILLNKKKVAGILCERFRGFTIVGIGVNAFSPAAMAPELSGKATTVNISPKGKTLLMAAIIEKIEAFHSRFIEAGFAQFKNRFEKRLEAIGKKITLASGRNEYRGTLRGIDDRGAIVLETNTERVILSSAEITAHEFKGEEVFL